MKSCKLIFFCVCFASIVAFSLSVATAQSVCEGIGRILDAGRYDRPPFSSLQLHSLPGAVCDVDEAAAHRAYFKCFWEAESQKLRRREQKEIAKRFATSINECIEKGALHQVEWRSWKERNGEWKIKGKTEEGSITMTLLFAHKGLMDKYAGDSTDGVYLKVYSWQYSK